jgi:tol-pal system protein YbgF
MSLASAQFLRPSVDVPDAVYQSAQSTDAAAAQLRIDRLENQMRSMTGQIEEMQFQIRRLEDQLRKFQQDVDFRFDEQKGGKPPGGARPTPQAPAPTAPATPPRRTDLNENGYPVVTQAAPTSRRGDAFDPAQDPAAPGAPRDLAIMAPGANASAPRIAGLPSGPLEAVQAADPDAPPDLTRRLLAPASRAAAVDPAATASLQAPSRSGPAPQVIPAPAGAPDDPLAEPPAQVASLPQPSPADDYDVATAALKEGRYDVAEQRFRSYLDQHPKDRLTPEAMFHLGESFFRRSRPREAAEQYLKVTVDFPRAARAPEALVKLGLSLEKLGAVEQACAAFGEVARKYPAAPSAVRVSAARESKRVQC